MTNENKDTFITLSGMKISKEDWYAHADEYLEIHQHESMHVSQWMYYNPSIDRMMT